MRKIFLLIFLVSIPIAVFAYTSPGKPTGYVNDFAGVLSADQEQTIENKLHSLETSTGVQFSVVTVDSLGDETVETYATRLFQEWGIGSKDKDTGLLILVVPNDKEVRIEVGYGLEGILNDAKVGAIGRSTLSVAFETGDYYNGIFNATLDVGQEIVDNYQPPANAHPGNASLFTIDWRSILIGIVIFVAVAVLTKGKSIIWIGSIVKRRGFGGGGSGGGGADG